MSAKRWSGTRWGRRLAMMVAGLVFAWGAEATGSVEGRVVDEANEPVAGAEVRLLGGDWDDPQLLERTTTDEAGRFTVPDFGDVDHARQPQVRSLLVLAPDGRLGWIDLLRSQGGNQPEIVVKPVAEAQGRVVNQDGVPMAGAAVRIRIFGIPRGEEISSFDYTLLDPELAEARKAMTDDDGAFTLADVLEGGYIHVEIEAPGFGVWRVAWIANEPVAITLDDRLGRLQGRIALPEGVELADATATLTVWGQGGVDETEPYRVTTSRTIPVAADGGFEADDLPPGTYRLQPQFGPEVLLRAEGQAGIKLAPEGEVAGIALPVEPLLRITGRVVDPETGEGIEGVRIQADSVDGRHNALQYVDQATTDAEGRYRVRGRAGTMQVRAVRTPTAYLPPMASEVPRLDVEANPQWPDLELASATSIEVRVVGADGEPISGAEVDLLRADTFGFAGRDSRLRSGRDGWVQFDQLDPTDTVPIRARTSEATTDGAVVIRPEEQEGPLELTITPDFAFHVSGIVTDQAGRPIEGANVSLWWSRSYVSEKTEMSSVGSVLESYTTEAEGRFASTALWPGDRYHVAIEAEGYGRAESAELTGRAGVAHDFGSIALIGQAGSLAGIVVDSAGTPVADAEVFNRGDGPALVTTRTDADGRFRLEGLFDGSKYAFIRKESHRFTGHRVEGNADDLMITLLRLDEPPPSSEPVASASYEEQRAFAIEVLERVWERYGDEPNQTGAFVCLLTMAQIDPEKALQWSAQDGGRYDERIQRLAAEWMAWDDPEAAFEVLRGLPGSGSQYTYQQIADRLAKTNPEAALRFVEEAAVHARALDEPDRSRGLARAGALLVDLGHADTGRRLIEEVAEVVERMNTEGAEGYSRGIILAALARLDADRAIALLDGFEDPSAWARYAAMVASAIAAADPERALALADAMGDRSSSAATTRTEIAYRIGGDRLEDALAIIEGIEYGGSSEAKFRAEALAWLAVAVAERVRERAFDLIDQALALIVDDPGRVRSFTYYGGATGSAALIATCARRIGYPDMDSITARVLATRDPGRAFDTRMQIQADSAAAAVLALTDPDAARLLLQQIEARSGLAPADLSRNAHPLWLAAWGLVDLEHAGQLVEAELAALEDREEINLQLTGLFKLAEALGTPPERREDYLRKGISANWYPGFTE